MSSSSSTHYGRSFNGHWIEDACLCEQESCGLVSDDTKNLNCPQHSMMETIRQSHLSSECPGFTDSWVDVAGRKNAQVNV